MPWSHECDSGDDDCVKENAYQDGHRDGLEKFLTAKLGSGFFGRLANGFEPGHEIRDDLNHQQEGNQWRVGEEWRKVARRSFACADGYENYEQGERAEGCPVLEGRAEADTAVIQCSEQRGEAETEDKVWEIDGASGDAVDLDRI